jgi:hypothetical protein
MRGWDGMFVRMKREWYFLLLWIDVRGRRGRGVG